ncbi:MAG: type I-G CRISPR-associated helicase/endonuclease Cas3g [Thermoanaerobaculia bacterium]
MESYAAHFAITAGSGLEPRPWQFSLAADARCGNRLIRIPTGFGKTLGVLGAWLWHRVEQNDDAWPRRLVWCLPMRVLVEQTEAEIRAAIDRHSLLWKGGDHSAKVGVHVLMGGMDSGEWHLYPEECAVLIGTQDMLLSRGLNRGYGSPRARWPVEFGLVNVDALWVMDEVQLMDVGLATSAQLQVFRDDDREQRRLERPSYTWWMSATLQKDWLEKSPETRRFGDAMRCVVIEPTKRSGHLWDDVSKPLARQSVNGPKAVADVVATEHIAAGRGAKGPTLVVVNTVADSNEVYGALQTRKDLASTDIRLIHSRFRGRERARWSREFLNREGCCNGIDRIVVSTQVVEAGVDVSAGVLVTAIAPWPSLVQRFGRCARWGGSANVVVVDHNPKDDRTAAPYTAAAIDAARAALEHVEDVAPLHLERFEDSAGEFLKDLYPYEPRHLLIRRELDELFDITPDLSGGDVDISRFIRSGDERDLQVFWENVPEGKSPDSHLRASRDATCSVPFLGARDWLCGKETKSSRAPRLRKGIRAWVWDWVDGVWRRAERRDLYPGQTVLVAASCGGYDNSTGWSPASTQPVSVVPFSDLMPEDLSDSAENDEALSAYPWQTIAVHGREVGKLARKIAGVLAPTREALYDAAGRWHDAGKAHPAFQHSIVAQGRPSRSDLAKAPQDAWLPLRKLYPDQEHGQRVGYRHELASTLALFDVIQRHDPDHEALLGPWRVLLDAAGVAAETTRAAAGPPNELEKEILALSGDEFDLLAYLVCSHHGKVRVSWHASPSDQDAADEKLRIRGIRDGESMPAVVLTSGSGNFVEVGPSRLTLAPAGVGLNPATGRGWTERVLRVIDHNGPFATAWMEAILRAADCRASRSQIPDALLQVAEVTA